MPIPLGPMLAKFEVKVKAGAQFFQTQAIYQFRPVREIHESGSSVQSQGAGGHSGPAQRKDGRVYERQYSRACPSHMR